MRWFRTAVLLFASSLTLFVATANAEPMPNPDGLTVYDTVFQVNWLANPNLAHSNAFQVDNVNPSGSMDFAAAKHFVDALNTPQKGGRGYLNHNTWQLPATPFRDSSCDSTGLPILPMAGCPSEASKPLPGKNQGFHRGVFCKAPKAQSQRRQHPQVQDR